jgi:hypothetical protein
MAWVSSLRNIALFLSTCEWLGHAMGRQQDWTACGVFQQRLYLFVQV